MHAFCNQAVHVCVEPGEIVFTLFLFRLRPAALQAAVTHARLSYILVEVLE